MTDKETIYNALGMIEGAVCVSQKNTRDVLMKAINMIKDAIEEETNCECKCNHEWELVKTFEYTTDRINHCGEYRCRNCGKIDFIKL